MNKDNSQKEKGKTTITITPRITKLSIVLLTSALLVLSSITAARLFVTDNSAAFEVIINWMRQEKIVVEV
jgi:hypothetical protein